MRTGCAVQRRLSDRLWSGGTAAVCSWFAMHGVVYGGQGVCVWAAPRDGAAVSGGRREYLEVCRPIKNCSFKDQNEQD